jgi:hypothetical protein
MEQLLFIKKLGFQWNSYSLMFKLVSVRGKMRKKNTRMNYLRVKLLNLRKL